MKKLILTSCLLFSTYMMAQNEGNKLDSKWKQGKVYEYSGQFNESSSNIKTSEYTKNNHFFNTSFSIIEEDDKSYIVTSIIPNFPLFEAIDVVNKVSNKSLTPYKEIQINYRYDKSTGEIQLLGFEEIMDIYQDSKTTFPKFAKHSNKTLEKLSLIFSETDKMFRDEKTLLTTYKEQLSWFTFFLNQNLVLDKAIKTKSVKDIPLYNINEMKFEVTSTVTNIDKENKDFTYNVAFSLDNATIKDKAIKQVTNKLKSINSKQLDQIKKLKSYSYSSNFSENYTINYDETIPKLVEKNYIINGSIDNKIVVTKSISFKLTIKQ